jgi:uncharacterized repeat protein (TIGR03803 family)
MLKNVVLLLVVLVVVVGAGICSLPADAQTYRVLHSFGAPGDGDIPYAGVTFDSRGSLYGATAYGGSSACTPYGCGVTYKMTPNMDGSWTESVIHPFIGSDGSRPIGSVVVDGHGSVYGAAQDGYRGNGAIFRITPVQSGWSYSVINPFLRGGAGPSSPLTFDSEGNLYGTTIDDGVSGGVFVMYHASLIGSWYEIVLHAFRNGQDGAEPFGGVIFDQAGNLYGTTYAGGSNQNGTIFELTSNYPQFGWTETQLHVFSGPAGGGADGSEPLAGLVFDGAGNLYGTTVAGGSRGLGTVFRLTRNSDGSWSESILHSFQGGNDGSAPACQLVFDQAGSLYGTTTEGGIANYGTVFKLSPGLVGQWSESILHTFSGGLDGGLPYAGVTLDGAGNVYGTTQVGGPYGQYGGVVYKIIP